MKLFLFLSRYDRETKKHHTQHVLFDTALLGADEERASVATALAYINAHPEITDKDGGAVAPLAWECNCLQKRCGACAMVIDGSPRLACDARLSEFAKKGQVTIEPLKKFPVIEDLIVDRTVLFSHLRQLKLWTEKRPDREKNRDANGIGDEEKRAAVYEGSRCMQCGLCLEVCPNFHAEGDFFGTASAVPVSRILALQNAKPDTDLRALRKDYRARVFEGCGKSLACRNICPAGIDIDGVLARNAHTAVWRG